jgi:hypothetical protein
VAVGASQATELAIQRALADTQPAGEDEPARHRYMFRKFER